MSEKIRRPRDVSLLFVTNLAEAYKHYQSVLDDCSTDDEFDEASSRLHHAAKHVTAEHIRDCRRWLERNLD